MILDTASKTIEIILGAAKTTNDCEFTADYVDTINGTTFAPGGVIGVSNGVTAVTAVTAPTAGTQRSVRAFTIYNADTVNQAITVRQFDGTNRRRIVSLTLTPGQSLVFTPEAGWAVLPSTNGQIPGTKTNDNAAAGNVGEYIESVVMGGSPVPLTTLASVNIASVTLTPGDWMLDGYIEITPSAGCAPTQFLYAVNDTSATLPNRAFGGLSFLQLAFTAGQIIGFPTGSRRITVAAGTTATGYLIANVTFSAGTCGAYGSIHAHRMR